MPWDSLGACTSPLVSARSLQLPKTASGAGGGAELGAGLTNVSCWQVTLEKPASDSRLKSSSPIQEALPQRPGDRELGLGQPLHSLVHEVCHRQ